MPSAGCRCRGRDITTFPQYYCMDRQGGIEAACLFVLLLTGALFSGCLSSQAQNSPGQLTGDGWKTVLLRDVNTGKVFSVDSIANTPVVLFTFTVACPICTRQQQEITRLIAERGDTITVVGVDIDPNEDERVLRDHVRRNGFLGYYVLSTPKMTQSLLDRFGPRVVTPASAPVIVLCPGGKSRLLDPGIKSAAFLSASLGETC